MAKPPEQTLQKLLALKLPTMAAATRELLDSAPSNQLSFEDRLGINLSVGAGNAPGSCAGNRNRPGLVGRRAL